MKILMQNLSNLMETNVFGSCYISFSYSFDGMLYRRLIDLLWNFLPASRISNSFNISLKKEELYEKYI